MSFEKPAIVLDNGSYNVKAGFSCDNHPVSIFRTTVGRPNYLNGSYGQGDYDVYIGEEAVERIEDLELNSPVENGKIVHWDNMERIWHHCFYRELKAAPEDREVILGCSSKTSMEDKIKCCEIFFETLNCPGLCVLPQCVLSLFGSGCTTGLSVDLGYDTTDINPVYEGGQISYAHMQTNLAGRQLTDFMRCRLLERNLDFGLRSNEVIESIKQKLYLTKNATTNKKSQSYKQIFTLPSGEKIDISHEVFKTAEMLFQPDLVCDTNTGYLPLHKAVVTSVLKCDADLHTTFFENIVPWGGMATITGMNVRLHLEIEDLISRSCVVFNTTEPYTVAWLGGATFASTSDAKKIWITKKQFEDHGAKIVRNKFQ